MDSSPASAPLIIILVGWMVPVVITFVEIPQLYRTLRIRNIDGVSLPMQVSWVVSYLMWIAIALGVDAAPKVGEETVGLVVDATLLAAYLFAYHTHHNMKQTMRFLLGACWILLPVPLILWAGVAWGFAGITITLSIYDGLSVMPQMVKSLRAPSLKGLSLATWTLKIFLGLAGAIYAIGVGLPLLAGWGIVLLPMSVVIAIRIVIDRRKEKMQNVLPSSMDPVLV